MAHVKLTPKQEAFCQAYIETGNASEAYRRAYDAENMKTEVIHVKACELLKSGKVAVRVLDLQEILRKRHDVTMDSLTAEYEEARNLARRIEAPAAMVSATTGKGRLHGLIVERQQVSGANGGPFEIIDKTPAAVRSALDAIFKRHGPT